MARVRDVMWRDRFLCRHLPGDRVDVGQHRCGAGIRNGVGARNERKGRHDYLVAGADVASEHREMESYRAVRHGYGSRCADRGAKGFLELPDRLVAREASSFQAARQRFHFLAAQGGAVYRDSASCPPASCRLHSQ